MNSGWVDRIDDEAQLMALPPVCWSAPDPMQFCSEDEPRWKCDTKTGGCTPCVGKERLVCNPDLHACAAACHKRAESED